MLNNVVIACHTLSDELNLAYALTNCTYPVIWIDSEYHSDPNKLRKKLQETVDSVKDADNLLFAYGCCGNGLVGIHASTANLIIPKTEDCISMVMSKPGEKYERVKETYFLTKGWIESSKSISKEFENALKKYGFKKTKMIFEIMLKNYKYLMLIDTGAYNVAEYIPKAEEIARMTSLKLVLEKGDIWFLIKLLKGPYDEDFCVVKKGEKVTVEHFGFTVKDSFHQDSIIL